MQDLFPEDYISVNTLSVQLLRLVDSREARCSRTCLFRKCGVYLVATFF
jgi:hypothetical protein